MNEISIMFSIFERSKTDLFMDFFEECQGGSPDFVCLGYGTAASDTLSALGLNSSEKTFAVTAVTPDTWKKIKIGLHDRLNIHNPGAGIAFTVPLSSISGKQALRFMLDGQETTFEEESELKDTRYELIMVIANSGYSDMVMDAAKEGGAGGGTVLHAKGTGTHGSAKFFGVTLASEKEIILIVTKTETKNSIMGAINEKAGVSTPANAISLSLPVTHTAGIRFPGDDTE